MSLKIIESWYEKLPSYERDMPLIRLNNTVYTPTQILAEVTRESPVGAKLQEKVEGLRYGSTLEDESLAEERLVKLLEERPVRISMLTRPGEKEQLSSKELIERIKKKDRLGKSLIKTEEKHMLSMLKIK